MSEREIRERVTNVLLLLYLIERTTEGGKVEDELKLQKMVFLSQKKLIERKLKAFNYNFFKWLKGPFSAGVRVDFMALLQAKLVSFTSTGIEVNERGRELLRDCEELLNLNRLFLKYIDRIVDKYAKYSPDEIKDEVYSMKIIVPRIREIMSIKDVPPSQLILFKSSDQKSQAIFHMDNSWLATLELIFNTEALGSLKNALDDAVEGRAHELTL